MIYLYFVSLSLSPIRERMTLSLLNVIPSYTDGAVDQICPCVSDFLGRSSLSRIYHSYEEFTIAGEGLHANFDLCSVLMAIEPWGFFSVPHLLWHGASVYDGHLRGPVTLTPIAERFALELSLPVLRLWCFAAGIRTRTQSPACEANALTHCATATAGGCEDRIQLCWVNMHATLTTTKTISVEITDLLSVKTCFEIHLFIINRHIAFHDVDN